MKPLPLKAKIAIGAVVALLALYAVARLDVWYTERNAAMAPEAQPRDGGSEAPR
jgi:hypothetical protein